MEQSTTPEPETPKKARVVDEFLIQWEELYDFADDRSPERVFGTDVQPTEYHLDEEVPLEEAEGGFILLKQFQAIQDQMTPINNKQRETIVAAASIPVDRLEVFQATTTSGKRYELAYVWDESDNQEFILLATAGGEEVVAPETPSPQVSPPPYILVACWSGHPVLATREFLFESSDGSGPSCLIIKDRVPDEEDEADQEEESEEPSPDKVVTPSTCWIVRLTITPK